MGLTAAAGIVTTNVVESTSLTEKHGMTLTCSWTAQLGSQRLQGWLKLFLNLASLQNFTEVWGSALESERLEGKRYAVDDRQEEDGQ